MSARRLPREWVDTDPPVPYLTVLTLFRNVISEAQSERTPQLDAARGYHTFTNSPGGNSCSADGWFPASPHRAANKRQAGE